MPHTQYGTRYQLFLFGEELVDGRYQSVGIGSVYGASILNRLTARSGSAEAMHTDSKKELRGFAVVIKNIADDGLLCNFHFAISFLFGSIVYLRYT